MVDENRAIEKADDWGETLVKLGVPDDIRIVARQIKSFAGWANGKFPMTVMEVLGVAMKAQAMGVNALNPHEISVWKDLHGIHMEYAYPLIAEWVRESWGGHWSPKYARLIGEELDNECLTENDIAYKCRILLRKDVPLLSQGLEKEDIELVGLGVMTQAECVKKGVYASPNGRSISWVVRKRAYVDAIRQGLGTPTPEDCTMIRNKLHAVDLQPIDFILPPGVTELDDNSLVALAKASAARREPLLESDEIEIVAGALYPVMIENPSSIGPPQHIPDEDETQV